MLDNRVWAIAINDSGNKWIGTGGGGLTKFDTISRWKVYNKSNSVLPNDYVRAVAIDDSGNKWIGTWGGGLAVYREGGVILNVCKCNERVTPCKFMLYQNYPNPFNSVTIIEFDIAKESRVRLDVYDILGRVVKVLIDQHLSIGRYRVRFDGGGLSSGIYFYVLVADGFKSVKNMILVK